MGVRGGRRTAERTEGRGATEGRVGGGPPGREPHPASDQGDMGEHEDVVGIFLPDRRSFSLLGNRTPVSLSWVTPSQHVRGGRRPVPSPGWTQLSRLDVVTRDSGAWAR